MDFNLQLKLKGDLSIKKYSEDNRLIQQIDVPNLIVTAGRQHIASRIIGYVGSSASVMTHMGVGISGTLPVIGNTALNSQIARVALDSTPTRTNAIITYSATFGLGVAVGSIVEAGIFNASTGGTMLCHTVFPVVNKDTNETVTITWNISVG